MSWLFDVLPVPPTFPPDSRVCSAFYSDAKEIEAEPLLKVLMYTFERAGTWHDIGLQLLNASGLRPDCTQAYWSNFERALPPRPSEGAPLVIQATEVLGPGAPAIRLGYDKLESADRTGLVFS